MMIIEDIFDEYEQFAANAERAFAQVRRGHADLVKCRESCSDCCNSVFGLFLVESLYLNRHFSRLDRKTRRELASRADQAERDLREMEKRLSVLDEEPEKKALAMASERLRCPLLGTDDRCVLYDRRPVTCRAYGIPTVINGKIHSCWKAGFEKGRPYPAFNLDQAYRELYGLSGKILKRAGQGDTGRASLLLSVSRSIKETAEELLKTPRPAEGEEIK